MIYLRGQPIDTRLKLGDDRHTHLDSPSTFILSNTLKAALMETLSQRNHNIGLKRGIEQGLEQGTEEGILQGKARQGGHFKAFNRR